jgi:hypothetical protein
MRLATVWLRLRRFHRYFVVATVFLYAVAGASMLIIGDSPSFQGVLLLLLSIGHAGSTL